jgi:enamine deaminase RidA (YjgF/YER057c/UK114 family)
MATDVRNPTNEPAIDLDAQSLSDGERRELTQLGVLSMNGKVQAYENPARPEGRAAIKKHAIQAPQVLNEAYDYAKPSSFSRGLRVELGTASLLFISGTASIDEAGQTVHVGDFGAQCWRTYRNITTLLQAEGASWHDVVKTTCYLRDIERDYDQFNKIRTRFFGWLKLDPLPASVGVQARLCRQELLVEIEAMAIISSAQAKDGRMLL